MGDAIFRVPGECLESLRKSNTHLTSSYQTIIEGVTKLSSRGMSIVVGENLGLEDRCLKLAIDDGSHFMIQDLDQKEPPRIFQGLKSAVSVFAARADGKLYACGLQDGSVSIVRNDNARMGLLRSWRSKNPVNYPVACIQFLSTKVHVLSIDADRALSLWNLAESSEPIKYLPDIHSDSPTCILPYPNPFEPADRKKEDKKGKGGVSGALVDRTEFLVGFRDGVCKKYTVKFQDEEFKSLEMDWEMQIGDQNQPLSSLGWRDSKKEEFIAAHGAYISVCTREKILFAHQIHMSDITDMKCTDTTVVTSSSDGSLKAIKVDADRWTLIQRLSADCSVKVAVCDPTNQYLGYADAAGRYRVCRLTTNSAATASPSRSKHHRKLDKPWGGRWEKLMNQHRYREALIKASSTPLSESSEFRTALKVFEALIECGLVEKASDGLTGGELCQVLESLTGILKDQRAFWCQPTILIILKTVLLTNEQWLSRNAEENLIPPLCALQAALAPRPGTGPPECGSRAELSGGEVVVGSL